MGSSFDISFRRQIFTTILYLVLCTTKDSFGEITAVSPNQEGSSQYFQEGKQSQSDVQPSLAVPLGDTKLLSKAVTDSALETQDPQSEISVSMESMGKILSDVNRSEGNSNVLSDGHDQNKRDLPVTEGHQRKLETTNKVINEGLTDNLFQLSHVTDGGDDNCENINLQKVVKKEVKFPETSSIATLNGNQGNVPTTEWVNISDKLANRGAAEADIDSILSSIIVAASIAKSYAQSVGEKFSSEKFDCSPEDMWSKFSDPYQDLPELPSVPANPLLEEEIVEVYSLLQRWLVGLENATLDQISFNKPSSTTSATNAKDKKTLSTPVSFLGDFMDLKNFLENNLLHYIKKGLETVDAVPESTQTSAFLHQQHEIQESSFSDIRDMYVLKHYGEVLDYTVKVFSSFALQFRGRRGSLF